MFGFGRDKRDVDQVIFDIAEHGRAADHDRLFALLRDRELFSMVVGSSVPFRDGEKRTVAAGDQISLVAATLPNGLQCAAFFVDRNDSRLGDRYVGMTLVEAIRMVQRTPDLGGLLIQNSKQSWVGFPRDALPGILSKLE